MTLEWAVLKGDYVPLTIRCSLYCAALVIVYQRHYLAQRVCYGGKPCCTRPVGWGIVCRLARKEKPMTKMFSVLAVATAIISVINLVAGNATVAAVFAAQAGIALGGILFGEK